ncbi:OmpA family protein [Candidatus Sneabacter namystus]|uniref:OmpA family protein n=1 Tax=Candidatus Sneabacter namystus TaxID=2601646 RepID=A0A5C0UIP1_9RICK|nr:OmpA family protein [Candidatus Sneabacter namystus]QEK39620.1 OmpA family protein [Candidatus Sneabacter namystus]
MVKNVVKAISLVMLLSLSACKCSKKSCNDNMIAPEFGATGATLEKSAEKALREFETQVGDIVYFAFDSSELSSTAKNLLDKVAEWLAQHNNFSYNVIEGHCDVIGTREYNLALGERRAEQVKRYLVSCGIAPERLVVVSYGKEKLARLGSSPEDHSANRRGIVVPGVK